MLNLSHKKLDVWKFSINLISMIYKLTGKFPRIEIYGLTNQLRRASVSVASNLAEGASRGSAAERKRFYEIARSSLVEIDTQIEIALTLHYIELDEIPHISDLLNKIFAMLTKLIAVQK